MKHLNTMNELEIEAIAHTVVKNVLERVKSFDNDDPDYSEWVAGITGEENDENGDSTRKDAHERKYQGLDFWEQWGEDEIDTDDKADLEAIVRRAEKILQDEFDFDGKGGGGNKEDDTTPPDKLYVFQKND